MNGHNVSAGSFTLGDNIVGTGSIARGGAATLTVGNDLAVNAGSTFQFIAGDLAQNLSVGGGSSATTGRPAATNSPTR